MTLAKEALTLNFFYAKHDETQRNTLISFLPAPLQKKILAQKKATYSEKTLDFTTLFSFIHPSHITDYLATLEPDEAKLFLSTLKAPNDPAYINSLNLKPFEPLDLNPGYKNFLSKLLFKKICASQNFLAQEFLKNEEFIHLLYLEFNAFNRLLEVLAMYDIHIELHTIISREQIIHLTQALSEDQCQFLKEIQRDSKIESFYPMGLKSFDGSRTNLNLILRQRALNRLAKAIAQESPEFIDELYFRLSSVEKSLFKKLLQAYKGTEFNKQKDHLKRVIAFIQG
jgi:hypothetical protein